MIPHNIESKKFGNYRVGYDKTGYAQRIYGSYGDYQIRTCLGTKFCKTLKEASEILSNLDCKQTYSSTLK